jgi:formate hydrogenlyase subunit 3/multisubunit Na+/H+ antiporter MnhD subunit
MVYLIIVIVFASILDIKDLKKKKQTKDMFVYIAFMLLVGALGIFYYSNPERASFSEILLSLIGQEG